MGVGYSASPLHRISYFDWVSMQGRPAGPGEVPSAGLILARKQGGQVTVYDGPPRFRSPPKADILTWRDGIARKYRDQLGENLSWNEDSAFQQSEDVATSSDFMLSYVAAVLDQRGPEAARALAHARRPDTSQPDELARVDALFAEASRRGFAGGFPQLLLNARYWFPYQRNMMMEEPNWEANIERYGSSVRLLDELAAIQTFITDADPGVTAWTLDNPAPDDDALAAAWEASAIVSRLCASAIAQNVPFWTTG